MTASFHNATRYLVDTDIAVDFLRGNKEATKFIKENAQELVFSVITHAELFCGVRSKAEKSELKEFLLMFPVIEINSKIAESAGEYKRENGSRNGMGLADAFIAASAVSTKLTLVTKNKKHFDFLENQITPY